MSILPTLPQWPLKIAVFDIDGVIFQTPSAEIVTDPDFWVEYWMNPEAQIPNQEMVDLFTCLKYQTSIFPVLLTARPLKYYGATAEALRRHGILGVVKPDSLLHTRETPIFMWNAGADADWHVSGGWKRSIVECLMDEMQVLFVLEDYKVNADAIRTVCPVLLYERVK